MRKIITKARRLEERRQERHGVQPLSDFDWRIVEAARVDGPRSLNPDGIVARLLRYFGESVPHGLSNEKLEALRRFAVRAWYWDWFRTKDLRALYNAGYSRIHVLEILSHVGMARGFTPSLTNEPAPLPSRKRSSYCRCG
jgi:hypothetical protein